MSYLLTESLPSNKKKRKCPVFIELHLKSDKSPLIIGLHHIVKIAPAGEGGTLLELASGATVHAAEPYADVKRTLEPR